MSMVDWDEVLADSYDDMADTLSRMQGEAQNDLLIDRLAEFEREMRNVADIHRDKAAHEAIDIEEIAEELAEREFE